MRTFVHEIVHSGAETVVDQLNGTPVARVGGSGKVRAAFKATDGTNTASLVGRSSGKIVIAPGSHAGAEVIAELKAQKEDFIYETSGLEIGEELDLEVVAASASSTLVAVST